MEIKNIQKLLIEVEGTDVENLKSAISKIAKGDTKIGFSKVPLTEDECKIIKQLNDKL